MRFLALPLIVAAILLPTLMWAGGGSPNNGKGHGTPQPAAPLTLTSRVVQMNPQTPAWCLSEDDLDQRTFSGSLSGSFPTSYQLCGLNPDGYTAGGIGLESDVSVVGVLTDLTITSPTGITHHAILISQSTDRGVTTTRYAVCFVPVYYRSSDTSGYPLAGGGWQVALSGQISSATWVTRAQMTNSVFQQNYCPQSQQNLAP